MNVHERTLSVLACRVGSSSLSVSTVLLLIRCCVLIDFICFVTVRIRGGDRCTFCSHKRFVGSFQGKRIHWAYINIELTFKSNSCLFMALCLQVDLVCHGKTNIYPDRDGSDPYAVRYVWTCTVMDWKLLMSLYRFFFVRIIFASLAGAEEKRDTTNCRQWEQPYYGCNCAKNNQKQVQLKARHFLNEWVVL